MYRAHICDGRTQSCVEHCKNVGKYTAEILKSINLYNTGYLSGLLHDMGKFSDEFDTYLEKASVGESVRKGSVIHSFAGVSIILRRYHSYYDGNNESGWENVTAEIIATAIGSHHGLFDEYNPDKYSGLEHRVNKQPEYDNKAAQHFFRECVTCEELDELFKEACLEIGIIVTRLSELAKGETENLCFYLGLLQRLINSALIDADRRDTAEFMADEVTNYLNMENTASVEIWAESLNNLNKLLKSFNCTTDIEMARAEMSEFCAKFAGYPNAVYRLNLPTGAGKTLSGLRYALEHAKKHGKKRIIFAVPLLSVLDQNVDVIKGAVGNDEIILEHHSNVVVEDNECDEYDDRDYLIETWDAPIVVTTLVQLLNTCFKGKTSSIRRFHALCDSVIIIDEVQSVPVKMISMFNLVMNFISEICGATVVLCSATQPKLENNKRHPLIVSDSNIIPAEKMQTYREVFKRNHIDYAGRLNITDVICMIENYLSDYGSVLVICNTKAEASKLYQEVISVVDNCIHLSTSMCMAHRKAIISKMRDTLDNRERLVCISTQLIEAGVDVSFGAVIRYNAGIDNVVQAAGRCNRNGESDKCAPVTVIDIEGEDLSHLQEIQRAQNATTELIVEFTNNQTRFKGELDSVESIDFYYSRLYDMLNRNLGSMDYEKDGHTLTDLLSLNQVCVTQSTPFTMRQAFKTAGEEFEVFETEQYSIIVPFEKGIDIITEIISSDAKHDLSYMRKLTAEAKEYCVNVFKYQYDILIKEDAIYSDDNNTVLILKPGYYNKNLGITYKREEDNEWNTLIL